MSSQVAPTPPPRRTSLTKKRPPAAAKKSVPLTVNGSSSKPTSPSSVAGGERTVKKLKLSKALTVPEGTSVLDACRRMAARRVDAALLTDSNALLSGIVTDKDIAARVIAEELRPEQTAVSKIMTRNPIFVTSDTLVIEALQKMVQGKFRHLPVVENGEVIALLDITRCLYDAISRMEKTAEQGIAIAAAVEGVECQMGNNFSAAAAFVEILREHMFKPSLATVITENTKVATVSPSDSVSVAAKKMRNFCVNSVVITSGNKVLGILTSRDILMRIVAQNLSPVLTLVEKVMTTNPGCANVETTILEALYIMHDGKVLHLPVLHRDGSFAACVDVLLLTHAAISMVENSSGTKNEMANPTMQKFWDSALALEAPDESDSQSEMSAAFMNSEGTDLGKYPSLGLGNSFSFKFEDPKGHVHRFNFATENLDELVSAVSDNNSPQLPYEDDGGKILLTCDSDFIGTALHARSLGQKSDEDTQHFLNMLDAATERVFEAYAENIAGESSAIHVRPTKQIVQSSPSLPQNFELPSKVSPQNSISPVSKLSSSPIEPQIKRKRRRTCEQPDFQQLFDANQIYLDLSDKNLSFKKDLRFVSWPQNFTFQSNDSTSPTQGSGSKQPSFYVNNNHRQLPKKSPSRIRKNLSNPGLYALDGNNVEGAREVEKSVDFSKAIEDAICRIESLILSLQKLVKPTHSSEQKRVVNSGLPNILSAVKPAGQEKEKERVTITNGLCLSDKSIGKAMLSPQASQMRTKPSSQVKWRKNSEYVESETTQESDLPSSSSESYESSGSDSYSSDESVPRHEKVGQSFTESAKSTASGYDDTSSYYKSLDEYSDAGPSSQMSSEQGHKWDRQREQGKRRGRLRRLGRKIGMIIHHHHHHHHHYRDDQDVRHARSFWKRFGALFHHTGNAKHRHNLQDEKPRKSEIKTLVKRKTKGGHFHALLGGLMKHMKHSKPEQVKGMKGLGNGCNRGLKKRKKLPWWSKFRGRRVGVKVSNKGKFRLGNYRTKSFVAAKMILKK